MFYSVGYLTVTHDVCMCSGQANLTRYYHRNLVYLKIAVHVAKKKYLSQITKASCVMKLQMTEPVSQRLISYLKAELLEGSQAVLGAWGRLNSLQHLAQR